MMTRFRVSFDHKASKVVVSDQSGNQRQFDTVDDATDFMDWLDNTEELHQSVDTTS